ncbi:MAG TPA: type II toxin-antitoxin system ParD family antitoxin [Cyanobacteria bacterium UBA8553]|nr:type II toxin-antitoxin system ParD family antitoxin [Cyanobacteria bacterium UBA8553]HAJ61440.1 type II toxin-antitoxin system ParD family antitoxin [Cyanobacteria bacterium UBA8543]
MNISLTPEQEQFIQEKINSGKYETADELITEAFRLLEERDKHYEKWVEETRKKVAVGIAQLDRGEGIDGEEVFQELLEEIEQAKVV